MCRVWTQIVTGCVPVGKMYPHRRGILFQGSFLEWNKRIASLLHVISDRCRAGLSGEVCQHWHVVRGDEDLLLAEWNGNPPQPFINYLTLLWSIMHRLLQLVGGKASPPIHKPLSRHQGRSPCKHQWLFHCPSVASKKQTFCPNKIHWKLQRHLLR